jgi:spermidine/putrescine transport system substrate-binding protein
MNSSGLRDGIIARRYSRRDLSRLLAAAGIGLVTVPVAGGRALAQEQALYYALGGFAEDPLFETYRALHGGNPDVSLWSDEEEAFIKMRGGFTPDVTYCGTYSVARWRDGDILQPIDTSRLTNWSNLFESLRNVTDAVADGEQWLCPVGWGTTSVLYRTDLVEDQDQSWGMLWDNRYAGRLAMIDNVADGVAGAAIYAGIDPYTMDEAAIAEVKKVMCAQKPLLRLYTMDMSSLQQAMASGEIVAAMTWNDAYAGLKGQGVPVTYMFNPKEGLSTWAACLVLNKNAAHVDLAYDLMNSITDPDAGAFWMTTYGFGHANQKAYGLVPAADLEALGIPTDPTTVLKSGIFQSRMENEDKVTIMFEEVKAGDCS